MYIHSLNKIGWLRRCTHQFSMRSYRTNGSVYGHLSDPSDGMNSSAQLKSLLQNESENNLLEFVQLNSHLLSKLVNPLVCNNTCDHEANKTLIAEHFRNSGFEASTVSCGKKKFSRDSSIESVLDHLVATYAGPITLETSHIRSAEERNWLLDHFERIEDLHPVSIEEKYRIARTLLKAEAFDNFLASKFASLKRYSGEGAETLLIAIENIFRSAVSDGVSNVVFGMPHRGRNNLLTVLLDYPLNLFFRKFQGLSEFSKGSLATGDTFSHYFTSADLSLPGLQNLNEQLKLRVSMMPNPSHLEANVPVCMGKARSKMETIRDGHYNDAEKRNGDKVMCLLVHGDASVTGQGVVAESLAIGGCPHFDTGGIIHLIVNNQVGFTTDSSRGSTFTSVSDVSKTIGVPIIHVNADNPEAVLRAARLATSFRQRFRKDVFIDLLCYRRWGHNELDDPTMTQPVMYKEIHQKESCPKTYLRTAFGETNSDLDKEVMTPVKNWNSYMHDQLSSVSPNQPPKDNLTFKENWIGFDPVSSGISEGLHVVETGLEVDLLVKLGKSSISVSNGGFNIHPTVKRSLIDRRFNLFNSPTVISERSIDWATAEAMAVASLLSSGHAVRFSGQDVGRGTFTHRHFMLVDQNNDGICIPLNDPVNGFPAKLEVANSPLSESAVLGFELGYASDDPRKLVIWEAQFGDFFNAAQVQIDTYIGSTEAKWYQQNGIVINLPHGYDGAGPEHSSCRLERWLQLTDSIQAPILQELQTESASKAEQHSVMMADSDACNLHVCFPSTPAQYFHLLRRQILRPFRRPLLVAAPKTLLRLPAARNSLADMGPGTHFKHVIADEIAPQAVSKVKHVVLCSGKHYYALRDHLETSIPLEKRGHFHIIRIEQLAPFPIQQLHDLLKPFTNAKSFIWSQEEHRNMGAWEFVSRRLKNFLGLELNYAGRMELATPAVGIGQLHKAENAALLKASFPSID